MITVEEALSIIRSQAVDFGTEEVALSAALGRVLKEDWHTDRELPPYDRVTMDGIAIQYDRWLAGQRAFKVEGVAAAGMEQQQLQEAEACLEVMTGAILPDNVDTVIRYEDVEIVDGTAQLQIEQLTHRQNVHFKGEDRSQGDLVVRANTVISSAEIGVGASIGKALVKVARLPRVMIISTGDELVEIDQQPKPYQIRRSNVYRLLTTLQGLQIQAEVDHLPDDPPQIREKLSRYLEDYEVVMLSGGVSKGKFDYLPQILDELGVEKLFHKIRQRPGKPFWFGQYQGRCTVFAFPGNPVSSFLCTERYFKTWLEMSLRQAILLEEFAELGADVHFKPDLKYFLEVRLSSSPNGQLIAQPVKGNGSGDLANLVDADAFIQLPRGRDDFPAGEVFPILRYR